MKKSKDHHSSPRTSSRELAELRVRLSDAEETLHAIRRGDVDAVVISGKLGPQVFTLQGAEHAYRVLMESMNEGALTLTAGAVVLYANQCFARMLGCPLERVIGSSFLRFLSAEDRARLLPLLRGSAESGSKIQVMLRADDDSLVPAQVSIRPIQKDGNNRASIGMVVTDMTEARRTEGLLRALTRRVIQVQEDERGRVALELHDNITQLLCAVQLRSQALAERLSDNEEPLKQEAVKLRDLLGKTADEVERISRDLRPGVLDQLGLDAVLRHTSREFAERTGVSVKLDCVRLTERLPADIELTLYRILQEALKNVEKHARARHVSVKLGKQEGFLQLAIDDDGIGFNPNRRSARRKGNVDLGLLGMRERASYVGGTLRLKSVRNVGTMVEASIPLPLSTRTARGSVGTNRTS